MTAQPDNPTQSAGLKPTRVASVLADAHRRESARVVAATVRTARDLDLAEECVQEAYAAALPAWTRDGIPANPAAWLTTAARRRAVDVIRREQTFRSKLPLLIEPEHDENSAEKTAMIEASKLGWNDPDSVVPDERLRLIFLCCHPALPQEVRSL